jgi:hypothetical protein
VPLIPQASTSATPGHHRHRRRQRPVPGDDDARRDLAPPGATGELLGVWRLGRFRLGDRPNRRWRSLRASPACRRRMSRCVRSGLGPRALVRKLTPPCKWLRCAVKSVGAQTTPLCQFPSYLGKRRGVNVRHLLAARLRAEQPGRPTTVAGLALAMALAMECRRVATQSSDQRLAVSLPVRAW